MTMCILRPRSDTEGLNAGFDIVGPLVDCHATGDDIDNPHWIGVELVPPPRQFTVIWGNIGDTTDRRLDFVTAEPNLEAVMAAAWACFHVDHPELAGETNLSFDGFAILDGHITDSNRVSFF